MPHWHPCYNLREMPGSQALRTFLLGVTVLSTTACGWNAEEPASAPRPPLVRVVHSWGDDTPYAEIVQAALTKSLKDVRVQMSGTNASVTNVFMLSRGEADAVFTFSDTAYMASVGQIPGMPQPFDEIRAIAGLPTRAVQIVVNPQSRVHSVPELRGGHVSLGPPGSGAALTSAFVLSAFGISLQDLNAERLEFREGARKVIAGGLDAAVLERFVPEREHCRSHASWRAAPEVTGPDVERFRVEYPFLKPSVIPAGTFPAWIGRFTRSVSMAFSCAVRVSTSPSFTSSRGHSSKW